MNAPAYVTHARLKTWVQDMVHLCQPDHVHWCDGSDAEYQSLCGVIRGLLTAQREINDLLRKVKDRDE